MDAITTQQPLSSEQIFNLLKTFITEVIGEEFVEDLDISRESSFTRDLEMDSIEIVSFSEKVKSHFGEHIDFTGWLSGMDLDQLINLKLDDIIKYIESCQSSK
ncbi:acyl carrier protein [Chitinophaga pinensis]|jgi:acyl carrier protein|uniref:Acyl carrier protein n=1 Tax=Chitinophaga pinensis TaxID=79329 RepID=A0A5C6LSW9_9BACT|nr:acyl carrier protein [Chitinophaga pinensis]TWV99773.1 acyl carrier protein [Chitinophaga pinensis]